jgi:hypothetical protein
MTYEMKIGMEVEILWVMTMIRIFEWGLIPSEHEHIKSSTLSRRMNEESMNDSLFDGMYDRIRMFSMVQRATFLDQVQQEVDACEMFKFFVLWEKTLVLLMMEMGILPMMERLIHGSVI